MTLRCRRVELSGFSVDVTVPRRIRLGENIHLLEERRRGANSLLIDGLQLVAVDTGEATERAVESIAGGVSWVHVCASANSRRRKTPAGSQQVRYRRVVASWLLLTNNSEPRPGLLVNLTSSLLTGFGFGPVAWRAAPLTAPHWLPGPLVIGDSLELAESMLSLPITLSTLEVSSVWALASWLFGIGLVNGFLERNRWHQPEVVVCVLT
jgi:hypothetical protein